MKTLSLFLFLSLVLFADEDILKYKERVIEEISSDPLKRSDPQYLYSRTLFTIRATDTDSIPKVPHAGEFIDAGYAFYQIMHNGVIVVKDCYYGGWMSDIIKGLKGHHEPQEEKAFYEVLKFIQPNATMIELGSYWGYYSLWFATAISGAKNYLVEPDPYRMNIGKVNFNLNEKKGHFIRGYAGLKDNDTADFVGAERIEIDSLLEREKIDHLQILHSDIQGAEYEMLKTCVKSIQSNKIDYFFISTHTDFVHDACLRFFQEYDCLILAEHRVGESCSEDGLIVARRKGMRGPEMIPIHKYPH
jgi:hypothetical protein